MITHSDPALENAAVPQQRRAPAPAGAAPALKDEPINVLLVDDEPKNLTVLETVLHDSGYRLFRAASADEALLALVVEEFALLVLDINMPGMSGFELANMIKQRKKTAGVPIIFLTAYYSEDKHVLEGYGTGAVDYLHKPVNPTILRSKVAVFAELYRKTRESALANRALLDEVTERRRIQEQLLQLNNELEQRVEERTAELVQTNNALRASEDRLRLVNEELEQRVTDRTQALRDRESRLHAILDTAADAIITINEHGLLSSVNRAAESMFGYSADEMIGQNVQLLVPSLDREEHDSYIANHLITGIDRSIGTGREARGRRKDGSLFPVELALGEVNNTQRWYTGILRDITWRKALERKVVETAAEEDQRIGRELHDGVGQELTGLGLMADALARRLRSPLAPGDREDRDEAELSVKLVTGLERVHQQVRTLCRGLIMAELDPEGVGMALAELAARTSDQSGISCSFDYPELVPVPDPITAGHLYRIAQEAVSNALRHGRPQHIRLALRSGPEGPCLSIEDDGIGMSDAPGPENRPVDGLGIPTMRYRAAMIGGTLQIGSVQGGGTRVSCILLARNDHVEN